MAGRVLLPLLHPAAADSGTTHPGEGAPATGEGDEVEDMPHPQAVEGLEAPDGDEGFGIIAEDFFAAGSDTAAASNDTAEDGPASLPEGPVPRIVLDAAPPATPPPTVLPARWERLEDPEDDDHGPARVAVGVGSEFTAEPIADPVVVTTRHALPPIPVTAIADIQRDIAQCLELLTLSRILRHRQLTPTEQGLWRQHGTDLAGRLAAVEATLSATFSLQPEYYDNLLRHVGRGFMPPWQDERGFARVLSFVLHCLELSPERDNRNRAILSRTGLPYGMELSGLSLKGLVKVGIRLSGARLIATDLSDCVLKNAQMNGIAARWADFSGSDLEGADLGNARFADANLEGTNLSDTILREAVFLRTRLDGARLVGAQLMGATFRDCIITRELLAGVELRGARFENFRLVDITAEELLARAAVVLFGVDREARKKRPTLGSPL